MHPSAQGWSHFNYSFPLQLPLSPMVAFPLGVEYALNVSIERLHDADPRHHRWVARLGDQDQGFHRCLPFWGFVFWLG